MTHLKRLCIYTLAGISGLAVARAQESSNEDPEIAALETTYRAELVGIRKDLGEKWLSALTALKDQLTREQKLDQAMMVRDELLRVQGLLDADPLPPPLPAAVGKKLTLTPREATLSGTPRLGKDGDFIGYWTEVGGSATWPIPADVAPGTYELILHFQVGNGGGGEFVAAIGDDQTLVGKVSATAGADGGWKTQRYALVGECVLDEYTGQLKITSTKHTATSLMNINLIELAPQGTWSELQAEIAAAGADGKPDAGRRAPFEKLEGVRWVDKPGRKSGEVTVKHGEKEYTFRPYFVQLPPSSEPTSRFAKQDLTRSAKYLRTTEAKLLRFGKKVDEELRDRLWAESLTIYTRWENRGRVDSFYAYVLVDDEPLSYQLIENGEARLSGGFATAAPFISEEKNSAKTYLNRLKAVEKVARKNRRGMWGL